MKINIDLIYPIGAVYISTNTINPSTLFGGEWRQIKDRFLLACGDIYDLGKQDGEATHKLTIDEMPSHKHDLKAPSSNIGASGNSIGNEFVVSDTQGKSLPKWTVAIGGNQAHNNMPPYLAVCIWERIG